MKKYWDKISQSGIKPEDSREQKFRIILTNQFVMITVVSIFTAGAIFLIMDVTALGVAGLVASVIFAVHLWLIRAGYYEYSLRSLIITANLIIFSMDNILGFGSGLYVYYIPLLLATAFVIKPSRLFEFMSLLLLPFTLFIITIIGGHNYFHIPVLEHNIRIMFYGNMILTFLIMFAFSYVVVVNNQSYSRRLKRQNEELKKLNQALDQFVYSASHDLRAPIASVLGLIDLARHEMDPVRIQSYLDMKEKSLVKLDHFIKDIIDYSRNARLDIRKDHVDFEEILNEILEQLSFQEGAQKVSTSIQVDYNSEFYSDKRRISIVLTNLVSNAIRYHDPEKPNPKIRMHATINPDKAIVTVADNGIGIAEDQTEKIYEMFYRATDLRTGSGLGLYIVKETVEKLGGEIRVESELNRGTTFTLEIPNFIPSAKRIDKVLEKEVDVH